MSKIIIESRGVVDKYIGDAIMAFWNSPLRVVNHQLTSCRVALQSQERLRELHLSTRLPIQTHSKQTNEKINPTNTINNF